MAEEHILINEIIGTEEERMLYLKKYYPFFVLSETSFAQYKEGQYHDLDMGYIIMGLLRFLIEQNHFNGRAVKYEEAERFLTRLLLRDFPGVFAGAEDSDIGSRENLRELARFIFDKIRNDGKPFVFPFYDPESHTRREGFVRMIESMVQDGEVVYSITVDGIEFYLSTREVREESNISTEQLLLTKMIRTENFKGGIDVIRRINLEVELLKKERLEVTRLLREDLPRGLERSREYMDRMSKWFELERKSFQKNKQLVDRAAARFASKEITQLETELKKTIESHRMLMEDAVELSRMSGEMMERAKLRSLRPAFDFRETLRLLELKDDPGGMLQVIAPFLMPRRRKSLSIYSINKLVDEAVSTDEEQEKRKIPKPDLAFEYEDEKLSRMTGQNFAFLFRELLDRIKRWDSLTLNELNAIYETKFGKEVYRNRDYYSFLVHLAKKDKYNMTESFAEPETFLEGYAAEFFTKEEKARFGDLAFRIEYGDELTELGPGSVRTMRFVRL